MKKKKEVMSNCQSGAFLGEVWLWSSSSWKWTCWDYDVFHKVMTNCQSIFARGLALGLAAVGTRLFRNRNLCFIT